METIFLISLLFVNTILLIILWFKKTSNIDAGMHPKIDQLQFLLEKIEKNIKDDFKTNRSEINDQLAMNRKELNENIDILVNTLKNDFREFKTSFENQFKDYSESQRTKFTELVQNTDKNLEKMRETVDEKLQKTLNERLGQTFDTVGKQLNEVQAGLGEMRHLAQDVGGLKKVLSNVKQRGGLGEIQLEMLLEQILAPDQYEANVKTKKGSQDLVEFAIKLPGKDDQQSHVFLPIDAKFPKDSYEQLIDAYDSGDTALIESANKNLESTIKKMAKDIRDKYIDPPHTTDFAILFVPFEGIYAEVIRRSHLLEQLQREFKVIVTGPTTLAAILNSLQMGFRTLALQKRSSEVWEILGSVKNEFEKFGGLLEKAQNNIRQAGNNIEELLGTRTKAINKRLKEVESLPTANPQITPNIMPRGKESAEG
jgi:DNA recombination protein RmuC